MNNAAILLAITALLIATNTGCEQSNATGNADEAPAAVYGELRVSTDAQAAIGIAIETVKSQKVRDSISTTGWLAARPASEVIVKAPTTGFVTLKENNPISLGDFVTKNRKSGRIACFSFTPAADLRNREFGG